MRPPPLPRARPTAFGRPGSASAHVHLEPAGSSQPPTNRAISASPAPPGTSAGVDGVDRDQLGQQRTCVFHARQTSEPDGARGLGDPDIIPVSARARPRRRAPRPPPGRTRRPARAGRPRAPGPRCRRAPWCAACMRVERLRQPRDAGRAAVALHDHRRHGLPVLVAEVDRGRVAQTPVGDAGAPDRDRREAAARVQVRDAPEREVHPQRAQVAVLLVHRKALQQAVRRAAQHPHAGHVRQLVGDGAVPLQHVAGAPHRPLDVGDAVDHEALGQLLAEDLDAGQLLALLAAADHEDDRVRGGPVAARTGRSGAAPPRRRPSGSGWRRSRPPPPRRSRSCACRSAPTAPRTGAGRRPWCARPFGPRCRPPRARRPRCSSPASPGRPASPSSTAAPARTAR